MTTLDVLARLRMEAALLAPGDRKSLLLEACGLIASLQADVDRYKLYGENVGRTLTDLRKAVSDSGMDDLLAPASEDAVPLEGHYPEPGIEAMEAGERLARASLSQFHPE